MLELHNISSKFTKRKLMARTPVDRYKTILWTARRVYSSYPVDEFLWLSTEYPASIGLFLAVTPPEMLLLIDEWTNRYPTDENGWKAALAEEWVRIGGVGPVTEADKNKERTLVENIRQHRIKNLP